MNVLFWVLGTGIFLVLVLVSIKTIALRQQKKILEKFKDKKILEMSAGANFFGQESSGMVQVRGNGALVLMEDSLYFKMWVPERDFSIPVKAMVTTEIVSSHLGKTKLQSLFKVVFTNQKGEKDSAAWLVANPHKWVEKVNNLKAR